MLFDTKPTGPLPELLRPARIEDIVGQAHLLQPAHPLRKAFDLKKPSSFILQGPPGVGKTSFARIAAATFQCEFIELSAVDSGVKEIREVAAGAQERLNMRNKKTVLFIDEIHRFTKAQQDALLPHVESGLLTLIAATTKSVSFNVDPALLSRVQVYELKPLEAKDFRTLYVRARALGAAPPLDDSCIELLSGGADGDGRRFLNLLESVALVVDPAETRPMTREQLIDCLGPRAHRFDKSGFYEQISALQKSIRGSSPDAALYWLARLIAGGADPKDILRRLVVIASEDIGNADPQALVVAVAAYEGFERVGQPEGEIVIAQAVTYLASALKSNASYDAWKKAKAFVKADKSREVPLHLRTAPTAFLKQLGVGSTYRYPHDEPEGFAAGQSYMPDGLADRSWYHPVDRGYEVVLKERLRELADRHEKAR